MAEAPSPTPSVGQAETSQAQACKENYQTELGIPEEERRLNILATLNREEQPEVPDVVACSVQPNKHTSSEASQESLTLEHHIRITRKIGVSNPPRPVILKSVAPANDSLLENESIITAHAVRVRHPDTVSKTGDGSGGPSIASSESQP